MGWLTLRQTRRAPGLTKVARGPLNERDLLQVESAAKTLWGIESASATLPKQSNDQMQDLVRSLVNRQSEQARQEIRSLLEEKSQKKSPSADLSRKFGILTAALSDKQQALRRFREARRLSARLTPAQALQEGWLWQSVYGAARLTKDDLPRVRETLRTLHLGWYEHLVRETAYRKLGDNTAAESEHRALVQKNGKSFQATGVVFLLMSCVVFMGCLALNVIALVLWLQGKLKFEALRQVNLPPRPLFETFALYFFLQNVPPLFFRGRWASLELVIALELLPLTSLVWLGSQLRERGLNFGEIGLRWRGWWKEALWGVAAYLTVLPWLVMALICFALLVLFFRLPLPYHPIQDVVQSQPSAGVLLFLFLLAACFAPLIEEIFFRGVLHGAVRRWGGALVGTVLSAAFFALLHPQGAGALIFGLPIFALGALFSCMYELRGSIIPNIVAHGINNAVVLAVFTLVTR